MVLAIFANPLVSKMGVVCFELTLRELNVQKINALSFFSSIFVDYYFKVNDSFYVAEIRDS